MSPRDPIETRARIAAAALQLLREKGASGLSMRQVAARSGLSLSNVQYHYSSRERLLVGITEHHLELCHAALEVALGRHEEITLRAVLQASLLDEGVAEVTPPFRELFALALGEPRVHELLMDHYTVSHSQLTQLLAQMAPGRADTDVREVAGVLMAAIEGAPLLQEATGLTAEAMVDRLEATAFLLLGLCG